MSSSTFTGYDRTSGFLIQEQLPTQWHLLAAAVLLNRSKRTDKWDRIVYELFGRWPNASSLAASSSELEALLTPMGFANRKAATLRKMSEAYLEWDQVDARDLPGIGEYGATSWEIFVLGDRPEYVCDGPLSEFLERERIDSVHDMPI